MDITSASLALPVLWGTLGGVCLLTRVPAAAAALAQTVVPDHVFSNTIKGIAMLMVLYHHFRIYHQKAYWYLFGGGALYVGVSLFFFISGYGLVRSYRKAPRPIPVFLWHRAKVLLPMVILCMVFRLFAAPLMGFDVSLSPDGIAYLGVPEWFLLAIWVWYVVLIVILSAARNRSTEWGMLATASALLYGLLILWEPDSWIARLWMRFPVSFAVGAVMADHLESVLERVQRHACLPAVLWFGVSTALLFSMFTVGRPFWRGGLGEIAGNVLVDCAAVVCGVMFCVLLLRVAGKFRVLTRIGQLSLSVYLIQDPLIRYGIWFSEPAPMDSKSGVLVLLATGIGIVLAAMALDSMQRMVQSAAKALFARNSSSLGMP